MQPDVLIKLQRTELEILEVVHNFCVKEHIKYSLYAGTALGAVRHLGFIPWDDDIDIVMTRNQYNKFCECWENHPIDGFFLQNVKTDSDTNIDHAKVRKDGTILLTDGDNIEKGHNGIWIDIFPLDKIPKNFLGKSHLYFNGIRRNIFNRGNLINENENWKKKFLKKLLQMIPKSIRSKQIYKANINIEKSNQQKSNYAWVDLSTLSCYKIHFPKDMPKKYTKIKFENKEFMIFKDYDEMLRLKYGNYMKLPPKEERICKHNPVKIKF
ncbi:LicD family protein [Anaerostipes faecalis]|uniref:LicD family protein n=1 Tax=Anaerostipes faecalis TaxID=2738446 RepID=UPI001C1E1B00|nr:LicD family protein [Anaerostipes faecalis]